MNKTEFSRAAEYVGTLPRNESRAGANKYLCTVAHDHRARCIKSARDCLYWARYDREAGDRESACWLLICAHRQRLEAAEWAERYARVMERSLRA